LGNAIHSANEIGSSTQPHGAIILLRQMILGEHA
jgi:hypothetical protein